MRRNVVFGSDCRSIRSSSLVAHSKRQVLLSCPRAGFARIAVRVSFLVHHLAVPRRLKLFAFQSRPGALCGGCSKMVPISSGSYSGERKSMMFDSFLIKNSLTPTFCVSDRGRLKMQALLKNTLRNVSVSFSLACTYAGGKVGFSCLRSKLRHTASLTGVFC